MEFHPKSYHPGIIPTICRPFGCIIHVILGGWMICENHPPTHNEAWLYMIKYWLKMLKSSSLKHKHVHDAKKKGQLIFVQKKTLFWGTSEKSRPLSCGTQTGPSDHSKPFASTSILGLETKKEFIFESITSTCPKGESCPIRTLKNNTKRLDINKSYFMVTKFFYKIRILRWFSFVLKAELNHCHRPTFFWFLEYSITDLYLLWVNQNHYIQDDKYYDFQKRKQAFY